MQVEQWQHLADLWGAAAPRREDRGGEPPPFAGVRVDAAVVDPRRGHLHRTSGGHDLPWLGVAVADDQPAAAFVSLVSELGDVGVDLGFQRGGEHPPGALADDLVDQRRAGRRTVLGRVLLGDYREHGRAFPTDASTSA